MQYSILNNSYYSVLLSDSCASVLWKDSECVFAQSCVNGSIIFFIVADLHIVHQAYPVNLEAWNQLPADQRAKIEAIAKEMEPGFWKISEGEHATRMQQLKDNGMTVAAPSTALAAAMQKATASMADEFGQKVPGAAEVIAEFKKRTGK